jgi:hypothetical protein
MKRFAKGHYKLTLFAIFGGVTLLYAWTYAHAPFSESNNTYILNGATTLAAAVVALILTRIVFYFQPEERPRLIWISFAICAWLWTVAEGIWGYLYTTVGEVPLFSAADILWLSGYIALTISMVRQFQLVFFSQKYTVAWAALGVWFAILASIETILLATHSEMPLNDFFRYFYLFADAAVGLAAVYLVIAFRGRTLAIPWLTVSSFVLTDILYIRLTETGVYDYVMSGISIAFVADTLYVAAYLTVAWGVFEQFLLLHSSADHSQTAR